LDTNPNARMQPFSLRVRTAVEARGWTALLMHDREAAARVGHIIASAEFRKQYRWGSPLEDFNPMVSVAWAADAALFAGDNRAAASGARTALKLAREKGYHPIETGVQAWAAEVLAWAGEPGEACTLLEQLSQE